MRYHDLAAAHYDAKWGISYGELGQSQVSGKLGKALGRRPEHSPRGLEIGAGTGYFGLNLVRAGVVGELAAVDISPGMLGQLERSAAGWTSRWTARRARRAPCPSPTTPSTWSSATPCCTTCPTWRRACASSTACCAPAARWPSAASPRCTATGCPRGPSAPPTGWRRSGARRCARARAPSGPAGRSEEDVLEQVVDVHAFTPAALNRRARSAGFSERARDRRGAGGQPVRLGQPHAGGKRRARRGAVAVAPVRLPRLPGPAGAGPGRAGGRACRRRCSTTCWSRPAPRGPEARFEARARRRAPPRAAPRARGRGRARPR